MARIVRPITFEEVLVLNCVILFMFLILFFPRKECYTVSNTKALLFCFLISVEFRDLENWFLFFPVSSGVFY